MRGMPCPSLQTLSDSVSVAGFTEYHADTWLTEYQLVPLTASDRRLRQKKRVVLSTRDDQLMIACDMTVTATASGHVQLRLSWCIAVSLMLYSLPYFNPPILHLASSEQWFWSGGRGILTEQYCTIIMSSSFRLVYWIGLWSHWA